jgi:hypothetical protein
MLTLAAAFLLLAIGAALFGYLGGGTLGFAAAVIFFAAFLWAIAAGRSASHPPSD